jgi:hypothetical protein
VTAGGAGAALLQRIEAYFDAVPRRRAALGFLRDRIRAGISDDVAGLYARAGFGRVATACFGRPA